MSPDQHERRVVGDQGILERRMSWPLSNTIPADARFRKLSRIAAESAGTTGPISAVRSAGMLSSAPTRPANLSSRAR